MNPNFTKRFLNYEKRILVKFCLYILFWCQLLLDFKPSYFVVCSKALLPSLTRAQCYKTFLSVVYECS